MYDEEIKKLKNAIDTANNICVFTGAGISCPSGIPDFRSADGLYNGDGMGKYSPEEIISHTFFMKHTDMFYDFYKSKMMYPEAKPNKAHIFFAELLIVVGTSLTVYPAASFLRYFGGNTVALINKSDITDKYNANIVINDDIVSVVNRLY